MKATYIFILALLLFNVNCHSQATGRSFRLFGIQNYSGELVFRGYYRQQEQMNEHYFENQENYYYSGGVLLNANTYLLHPNFCALNLGAGYMPGSNRSDYLVSPDFSEVRTLKKVNFTAAFLSNKKVSANANGNYDESFAKRENMTDIKTISRYIGGSLRFSNRYIPITIDVFRRKMDQTEVETGRRVNMDHYQIEGRAEQAFTKDDKQTLIYTHRFVSNLNENNYLTQNTSDDFNFNSNVETGRKKQFRFNTMISKNIQTGSFKLNIFRGIENIMISLRDNLTFNASYNYFNTLMVNGRLTENISKTSLNYKLFKSLSSTLFFEYMRMHQTFYTGTNTKVGFDIQYTKKIPWGQLTVNYGYFRFHNKYSTDSVNIYITREEHQLSDNRIELLNRPYVEEQTVMVRDNFGTIIYRSGLDYFLVARGQYLEIHRIPSGQIPNNGTVFVDYSAKQSGSYKYDANNHNFGASIFLFKGKMELYYRLAIQNYSNLENTDFVTLNYYTRNIAGIKVGLDFISGGVEYENYESSILPYRLVKFYLGIQTDFKNKLIFSINGDIQNYTMLSNKIAKDQKYADITGRVEYIIIRQLSLNLNVLYRKQQGYDIDLDLLTGRLELKSGFYQWDVTAGVEVYRRLYIGDRLDFRGVFIQISRRF